MDIVNLMQSMSLNVPEDPQESVFRLNACIINDNHTDIVFAEFANRCLIIATQHERAGSLLRVSIDQPEAVTEGVEPVYSVQVLFGVGNLEQQAVARHLAEQLRLNKTLMTFLNLNDYSVSTVRTLVAALQETRKNGTY